MGSLLSKPSSSKRFRDFDAVSQMKANKKLKLSLDEGDEDQRLIPSLPDEISLHILARLPRMYYLTLKSVCRRWKSAVTGRDLYQTRRQIGTTEDWLYVLLKAEADELIWHALDPESQKWQRLPPMPYSVNKDEPDKGGFHMWNVVGSSIRIADFIRGWFWRPNGLEQMPFCGCSVGTVNGCLYVLGGFSKATALNHVWKYDPCLNMWEKVCSMNSSRAFSKVALLNQKLYVVGGVSTGRNGLHPLLSAEVYDPVTDLWTDLPTMPFTKAQVLPTVFLTDVLKPIATGMASYLGKLYVPQSLYAWPFFFDIGGEIYDPGTNAWSTMPDGLGDGWPAKQAGTKLAVVVAGELYALEPSSSMESGQITKYDQLEDAWKVVVQQIPIRDFTDAEAPYLLAVFHGRLHVVTKGRNNNVIVMQAILENDASAAAPESPGMSSPPQEEAAAGVWKLIAAGDFGGAELVSCQVLSV